MKPSATNRRLYPLAICLCLLILLLQLSSVVNAAAAFGVWKITPSRRSSIYVASSHNTRRGICPRHDSSSPHLLLLLLRHPGAAQQQGQRQQTMIVTYPPRSASRLSLAWDPESVTLSSTTTTLLVSDVNVIDILTKLAYGIVTIVVVLFGLTFITANWLIPQAAKQLQENCQRDFPELWQQYQTILDENDETLVQRPDLIQELGNKYNQLFVEKMEQLKRDQEQVEQQYSSVNQSNPKQQSSPQQSNQNKMSDNVIDVSVKRESSSDENDD